MGVPGQKVGWSRLNRSVFVKRIMFSVNLVKCLIVVHGRQEGCEKTMSHDKKSTSDNTWNGLQFSPVMESIIYLAKTPALVHPSRDVSLSGFL